VVAIEEIRENANWREVFPRDALDGCTSALLLFCAAKLGAYDGVRVLERGITDVTAVDKHAGYLRAMRELYPREWDFVQADAWEFTAQASRTWDFVSVDPPTDLAEQVAEDLDLWAALAERSLIVGTHESLDPPEGFEVVELLRRSEHEGGWHWLVLRRLEP
jgi:16S rRNA G966 N2-methylase RsmD